MKDIITVFNRDGADLYFVKGKKIDSNTNEWTLKVDENHKWVLEYCRIIGDYPNNIEAVDPSGGPFLAIGSTLRGGKYKILKIIDIR